MTDPKILVGQDLLTRAKQCREIAESFTSADTRERMLQIAAEYEELARKAAGRDRPKSRSISRNAPGTS